MANPFCREIASNRNGQYHEKVVHLHTQIVQRCSSRFKVTFIAGFFVKY